MKKLILISFVSLSFKTFAQVDTTKIRTSPSQYCAEMQNGILVVTGDGKAITTDVITPDGILIKANGNIVNKDGISTVLKEGECIDAQGLIVHKSKNENLKEQKDETNLSRD